MYLKAAEIMSKGQIVLPDDTMKNMGLLVGDHVALIYDNENSRIIMRKLTSGNGRMTYEEFLKYRDIKIKNINHERIVRLFFPYLSSVTGNERLLPDLIGQITGIDTSALIVSTGCFNGIFDGIKSPYDGVDLYIRLNNDNRIYIYGSIPNEPMRELNDYEYVIFVLADDLNGYIERKFNRHIYITK